jgi:hypothetical protein
LESTNLWDYVVDPILFLIGLIVWTVRLIRLCALPTARASRNAMPAGEGGSVPE